MKKNIGSPDVVSRAPIDELDDYVKKYVLDAGYAHIIYFDQKDRSLADSIASIFELNGWKLNYTKFPQGMHNPHHVEGIIIAGYNKFFLEKVANAFRHSGFSNMATELKEIAKDNPNREMLQTRIDITIGYNP